MSSILDRHFAPLQTALDLRAYRQQLLAANMANADTPNYKAVDLDFGAAFRQALHGQDGALPLATDQAGQIQPVTGQPVGASHVVFEAGNNTRLDGNSVNMDREQSAFTSNSIQYEAALTFLTGKIKTLASAIIGN